MSRFMVLLSLVACGSQFGASKTPLQRDFVLSGTHNGWVVIEYGVDGVGPSPVKDGRRRRRTARPFPLCPTTVSFGLTNTQPRELRLLSVAAEPVRTRTYRRFSPSESLSISMRAKAQREPRQPFPKDYGTATFPSLAWTDKNAPMAAAPAAPSPGTPDASRTVSW